jgi:hypothetical protein
MVTCAVLLAASMALQAPAPAASSSSFVGVWTMNKDLSDARGDQNAGGDDAGRQGDTGGGGGYGRRGGRGGFGGGYGGRGMGRGGAGAPTRSPEEMARIRDAMRDVMNPSDRLTIVQTDSMILITGADGRTTRLSPDGKKIKDENTGVERKTKWDAGKLVSEISGLGPGKMTQTFAVDPETHQLRITVEAQGGRSRQPRTVTHVYDPAKDAGDR